MSEPSLTRLEELFQHVVDLPADERGPKLEELCPEDPALRREVQSLLDHDEASADCFLEREDLERSPYTPGTMIGRYELVNPIGEGGCGEVYCALQHDPVERRVAIKLIKMGMDTREVISRFKAERQALAMMDHPNIAQILDGGATSTGRPYFVMEFVPGLPVHEYCDQEALDIAGRLELFAEICDAVQHAHQKGIIHRDLKPSNVLVEAVDDRVVPKVIDFGIAKAMGTGLGARTLVTGAGQLIGTPEYMSPEQAGMGDGVDARSDIYSLGVVLYELVAGVLPFDPGTLRARSLHEVQRIIREETPARPSTRLSRLGAEDVALHRRTDLRTLRRRLQGDLDWITMKAMEKDPSRRYASASELAADVRRHLQHEPVLAGPPGATYRMGRFVRRHRAAVVSLVLVTTAVLAGTIGVVAQSQRAAREAESAAAVGDFLVNLLASVDPMQMRLFSGFAVSGATDPASVVGSGSEVSPRLLAAAADQLELHDVQPQIEAHIREAMGVAFLSMYRHEEAVTHLRAALEIRRRLQGDLDPDTSRSRMQLGYALAHGLSGKYDEAEELLRWALRDIRARAGERDPETLNCARALAETLSADWQLREADQLFAETLERQREVLEPGHPDTLMTQYQWATSSMWQGRYRRGRRLARECHELCTRFLDPNHIVRIHAEGASGVFALLHGERALAEEALGSVLEKCELRLGGEHPFTYLMKRVYAQSLPTEQAARRSALYEEAIEGQTRLLGRAHRETVYTKWGLSMIVERQGDRARSVQLLREAFDDYTATRGDDDVNAALLGSSLFVVLSVSGKVREADEIAVRCRLGAEQIGDRDDATPFELSQAAQMLGLWLPPRHRDVVAALQMARRAVATADAEELRETFVGLPAYLHSTLALMCAVNGLEPERVAAHRERLDLLLELDARVRSLCSVGGHIVKRPGLDPDAYEHALQGLDRALERVDEDEDERGAILANIGTARYRLGSYEAALEPLINADELEEGDSPRALVVLAMTHRRLDQHEEARDALTRLRELLRKKPWKAIPVNRRLLEEAETLLEP